MDKVGERIRIQRKLLNITQEQLAKEIGVTQDSISLWERGKRLPDTQYIASLCKILDVSADFLLGLSDQ